MAHPKKLDPIQKALIEAAEDAEEGIDVAGTHGYSTQLRDFKRSRESRRARVPTFDNPTNSTNE